MYLFFFRFFSQVGYPRVLSRVPSAIQQVLVDYLFYSQHCVISSITRYHFSSGSIFIFLSGDQPKLREVRMPPVQVVCSRQDREHPGSPSPTRQMYWGDVAEISTRPALAPWEGKCLPPAPGNENCLEAIPPSGSLSSWALPASCDLEPISHSVSLVPRPLQTSPHPPQASLPPSLSLPPILPKPPSHPPWPSASQVPWAPEPSPTASLSCAPLSPLVSCSRVSLP